MEANWDVGKYFKGGEPSEQWEMRRKFMETYKNVFYEEKVACFAQLLVNYTYFGVGYKFFFPFILN